MKKLVLVLTLVLGLSGLAWAGDSNGVGVDLTVPYFNKYVSRGLTANDDPVLQPGASLTYKGFLFNVWGNYNLTNKVGAKDKFTEVDLTAEYTFEAGNLSFPVGVIHYLFPNTTQPNTTEVYAGVAYKWIVTPAFKLYHDVGDVSGQYATLSLTYEHEMPGSKAVSWKLVPVVQQGWGSSDFNKYGYNVGVDKSALLDTVLQVTVPVKINDVFSITPGIHQVFLMDNAISDAAGYDSKTYFSLVLGVSF